MTQDRATPAPHLALAVLPGVTEPASSNTRTEPVTDPVTRPGVTGNADEPVTGSPVGNTPVSLSPVERARLAAAHWAGTAAGGAAQLWLHPGRVLHVLWHGKPESMAEHRAYVKSRAWVPEELSGKPETVIALAGILYHLIIARPLKIAFRAGDAAAERPLRLFLLAASCVLLYLIVPHI